MSKIYIRPGYDKLILVDELLSVLLNVSITNQVKEFEEEVKKLLHQPDTPAAVEEAGEAAEATGEADVDVELEKNRLERHETKVENYQEIKQEKYEDWFVNVERFNIKATVKTGYKHTSEYNIPIKECLDDIPNNEDNDTHNDTHLDMANIMLDIDNKATFVKVYIGSFLKYKNIQFNGGDYSGNGLNYDDKHLNPVLPLNDCKSEKEIKYAYGAINKKLNTFKTDYFNRFEKCNRIIAKGDYLKLMKKETDIQITIMYLLRGIYCEVPINNSFRINKLYYGGIKQHLDEITQLCSHMNTYGKSCPNTIKSVNSLKDDLNTSNGSSLIGLISNLEEGNQKSVFNGLIKIDEILDQIVLPLKEMYRKKNVSNDGGMINKKLKEITRNIELNYQQLYYPKIQQINFLLISEMDIPDGEKYYCNMGNKQQITEINKKYEVFSLGIKDIMDISDYSISGYNKLSNKYKATFTDDFCNQVKQYGRTFVKCAKKWGWGSVNGLDSIFDNQPIRENKQSVALAEFKDNLSVLDREKDATHEAGLLRSDGLAFPRRQTHDKYIVENILKCPNIAIFYKPDYLKGILNLFPTGNKCGQLFKEIINVSEQNKIMSLKVLRGVISEAHGVFGIDENRGDSRKSPRSKSKSKAALDLDLDFRGPVDTSGITGRLSRVSSGLGEAVRGINVNHFGSAYRSLDGLFPYGSNLGNEKKIYFQKAFEIHQIKDIEDIHELMPGIVKELLNTIDMLIADDEDEEGGKGDRTWIEPAIRRLNNISEAKLKERKTDNEKKEERRGNMWGSIGKVEKGLSKKPASAATAAVLKAIIEHRESRRNGSPAEIKATQEKLDKAKAIEAVEAVKEAEAVEAVKEAEAIEAVKAVKTADAARVDAAGDTVTGVAKPTIKVIPGKKGVSADTPLDAKGQKKFERVDKDLKSLKEFHFPKIKEEFRKIYKKERVFSYQRDVTQEIKTYHGDITKLINDLMWLKGVFQNNYEELLELREIILNKGGGAGRLDGRWSKEPRDRVVRDISTNKDANKTIIYLMDIAKNHRQKVEEMINELENIISKLNNRYGIGKGSKSKDVRYYEATLKRLNDSIDYDSSEYINACKQVKSFTPYNQKLSGHDDISRNIERAQKKCNEISKKKDEVAQKKKGQIAEDKENKTKHQKEIASMKKKMDETQKQFKKGETPGAAPRGAKQLPPQAAQQGTPPPPGAAPSSVKPVDMKTPKPSAKGELPGKKSSSLNMDTGTLRKDEIRDKKLININEKQGSELVIPSKDKLNELSKVMNNDKFLDIIRNKNLGDFTEKEIKDVDIVRGRFNSFVNDYYELLNTFYNYKKNKERGEKEDIRELFKHEKQIESLKDIVIEYKTNLEKFKIACEIKVENEVIQKEQEIKEKDKEFKDVFEYLQELFKQELKEEKKATKTNTKILKEENDLQKEKILLLEDKKATVKKKRTPNKKAKPNKKRTPNKKRIPKKEVKQRTPTKKKASDKNNGGSKKKRTPPRSGVSFD